MFTGIIEQLGRVEKIVQDAGNLHFTISSELAPELKIDQSVSHNGVCLTVVELTPESHTVTAIQETLLKSNLQHLKEGDLVNLERSMLASTRVDGHFVQGHVDQTGTCVGIKEADGSWYFTFEFEENENNVIVEKGSMCVNGVSLTLVDVKANQFSVAIIPYTYEHTNFKNFKIGTSINLEFDIIGKYITQLFKRYK